MKLNSCLLLCALALLIACDDDPKPTTKADQTVITTADMQANADMQTQDQAVKDAETTTDIRVETDAMVVDMATNTYTACADGADNDSDGLIDLFDADCSNNQDNSEDGSADSAVCANGQDDDMDGKVDFPLDPGCSGIGDIAEEDAPVSPLCANGQDDDMDGNTDYPQDSSCLGAGLQAEELFCATRKLIDLNPAISATGYYDGDLSTAGESAFQGSCGGNAGPEMIFAWRVDVPLKSLTFSTIADQTTKPIALYVRQGCVSATDLACNRGNTTIAGTSVSLQNVEVGLYYVFVDTSAQSQGPGAFRLTVSSEAAEACRDTIDNDMDGLTDLRDPGCVDRFDADEIDPASAPQCADNRDNDSDGLTDYPEDSDCSAAGDDKEAPLCGISFNNSFVVPANGGMITVPFNPSVAESQGQGSCRPSSGPESVGVITITEPSAISVTFEDDTVPFMAYLRSDCATDASELACVSSSSQALNSQTLAAGTYFLFIDYQTANMTPASNPNILVVISSRVTECNDMVDNDRDGKLDLLDPGCTSLDDGSEIDPSEVPACANGQDDDGDNLIDYPADPECNAAGQISENIACTGIDSVPIVGNAGGSVVLDTTRSQNRNTSSNCGGQEAGPDLAVALILDKPSSVVATISSDVSGFDSLLYVRAGNCSNGMEIDCDDDGGDASLSMLSLDRLEAGVYYFIVDGYASDDAALLTLDFQVTPLVVPTTQCNDMADNDADNAIDFADPGCSSFQDDDESNLIVAPVCADGLDNDGDNLIDYPADTDCLAAGDTTEELRCMGLESVDLEGTEITVFPEANADDTVTANCGTTLGAPSVISFTVPEISDVTIRVSDDSNSLADRMIFVRAICDDQSTEKSCGYVVNGGSKKFSMLRAGRYYAFIGRTSVNDRSPLRVNFEFVSRLTECNDEIDNDADQLIDLFDTGCVDGNSRSELDPQVTPICADGLDNDGDNLIDYPADIHCTGAGGLYEQQLCAQENAIFVSGIGGSYDFEPVDGQNTSDASCSFGTGDEAVFAIQIDELSDLILDVRNSDNTTANVYRSLRTACDDVDTELACLSSFSLTNKFSNLEAGTYFLFVERSDFSINANDPFTVNLTIRNLITSCNDGIDNDGDNRIDRADAGCGDDFDEDETDPTVLPACFDALDNDNDNLIDYGQDPECIRASQDAETLSCARTAIERVFVQENGGSIMESIPVTTAGGTNNYTSTCGSNANSPDKVIAVVLTQRSDIVVETGNASGNYDTVLHVRKDSCDDATLELDCDDDGADAARMSKITLLAMAPGAYFFFVDGFGNSNSGTVNVSVKVTPLVVPTTQCNDQIDNDMDNLVDFSDPGCSSFQDDDEIDLPQPPACADGLDNDMDNVIDYPADSDCLSAGDQTESLRCATLESVDLVGTEAFVFPEANVDTSISANCASSVGLPSVVAFTVPELSDVTIKVQNANAMDVTYQRLLFVRSACDDRMSELACDANVISSSSTTLRLLRAGTYYAFVSRTTTLDRAPLKVSFSAVSRVTQCNDEVDNDGDNLVDLYDSGCVTGDSVSEQDPAQVPACADGLDNDGDNLIDYPQDTECSGAGGSYEQKLCTGITPTFVSGAGGSYRYTPNETRNISDPSCLFFSDTGDEAVFVIQITELSDVLVDVKDDDNSNSYVYRSLRTSCDEVATEVACYDDFDSNNRFPSLNPGTYFLFVERSEFSDPDPFTANITIRSLITECNDEVDNDNDSLVDRADPGCDNDFDDVELDNGETFACSDGIDNDNDGATDYPADRECGRASQNVETLFCNLATIERTLVQENATLQIDTTLAMNEYESTCGSSAGSGEKVFALILTQRSDITVTVTQASAGYDTVLHVRKDSCDNPDAELDCDDDGAGIPRSQISLPAAEVGAYFFFVDGYSNDNVGTASVNVVVTPR